MVRCPTALFYSQRLWQHSARNGSFWCGVEMAPPDVILGITEKCNHDLNPKKINLGVGAYRDDNGLPFIPPSIMKAKQNIFDRKLDHECAPIAGEGNFCRLSILLALGCNILIDKRLNATVQGIGGSGSLRIGGNFLARCFPGCKEIYLPKPTLLNHDHIFADSGLCVKKYKYFDPKTCGFDFKGALDDISKIPEESIIFLHACAQNPTGVDPKPEQWAELSSLIKKRRIFPFFDMAFQGFASGDVNVDAFAVRHFIDDGHKLALAQCYSKNMALSGCRAGAFTLIGTNKDEADRLLSQLKTEISLTYSNPPIYGSRLVTEILGDPSLKEEWLCDVKQMADRIISMRTSLRDNLKKLGSSRNWQHITEQCGMFCYTGLTPQQVERIQKEFSVYLVNDGRLSVAGVTSKNVTYLAEAMHAVTK